MVYFNNEEDNKRPEDLRNTEESTSAPGRDEDIRSISSSTGSVGSDNNRRSSIGSENNIVEENKDNVPTKKKRNERLNKLVNESLYKKPLGWAKTAFGYPIKFLNKYVTKGFFQGVGIVACGYAAAHAIPLIAFSVPGIVAAAATIAATVQFASIVTGIAADIYQKYKVRNLTKERDLLNKCNLEFNKQKSIIANDPKLDYLQERGYITKQEILKEKRQFKDVKRIEDIYRSLVTASTRLNVIGAIFSLIPGRSAHVDVLKDAATIKPQGAAIKASDVDKGNSKARVTRITELADEINKLDNPGINYDESVSKLKEATQKLAIENIALQRLVKEPDYSELRKGALADRFNILKAEEMAKKQSSPLQKVRMDNIIGDAFRAYNIIKPVPDSLLKDDDYAATKKLESSKEELNNNNSVIDKAKKIGRDGAQALKNRSRSSSTRSNTHNENNEITRF